MMMQMKELIISLDKNTIVFRSYSALLTGYILQFLQFEDLVDHCELYLT